jgi:general stress protein YciG
MEEKRPGQHPEADRPADDRQQRQTVRPEGGRAEGGLDPTEQDKALIRDADRRGAKTAATLHEGGFGDHKGVDGFPELPRED